MFASFPKIKLAYFFGSKASGKSGPLSDFDFAIYLDEKNRRRAFDLRLRLLNKLCQILKTDDVDLVIINQSENLELKYNIIKTGRLIFEREPFRLLVEPKILHEFFDFKIMLKKYNLTKA